MGEENSGLAIVRSAPSALYPANQAEMVERAKMLAASEMFGKKSPAQAFACIQLGMELGLPPGQALLGIHLIDGKPSPSADVLVACCLARPDICRYFVCDEELTTAESVTYVTWRAGAPKPSKRTFTLEDAKRAGLIGKDVWKKYGLQMLHSRAKALLARQVYPDLTRGLHTADEREEILESEREARRTRPVIEQIPQGQAVPGKVVDIEDFEGSSRETQEPKASEAPKDPDADLIARIRECSTVDGLSRCREEITALRLEHGTERRRNLAAEFSDAKGRIEKVVAQ